MPAVGFNYTGGDHIGFRADGRENFIAGFRVIKRHSCRAVHPDDFGKGGDIGHHIAAKREILVRHKEDRHEQDQQTARQQDNEF